jgi:glycosyltransferase involved in cell wall biosynthesis
MASQKKVALVQDWLTGIAGGEQVLLAMREILPEAPIYTSLYNRQKTPEFNDATVIPSALQKIPGLKSHHQIGIPLMPVAFEAFDLKEYDLIISLGAFAKGVISHPHQTHINYNHTPIRYAWRFGGDTRANGWLKDRIAHHLRIWDVVSSQRVDTFLSNSQNIAERIEKVYRRPATVVYPPVNIDRYRHVTRHVKDYYVTIGRLVFYKKIDLVVEAFIKNRLPLKVVGVGPDLKMLQKKAKNAPWIEFPGRVPDAELKVLLAGAKAFIFAAEEDFGIAPVEAMSAGCPVIAFGRGGALEYVKPKRNGFLFEEQTTESLSAVIEAVDPILPQMNSEEIKSSVTQFGKDVFLTRMREIIQSS